MSIEDREHWEVRHQTASTLTPLSSVASLPPAGAPGKLALDLACGQGRHSAVLALAGYLVVALDVSRHALRHLRAHLPPVSVPRVFAVQSDTDAWPFAPSCFDLIVQADFLDRRLFPTLAASLRPGGLLLIDTFLDQGRKNAHGPSRAEFLLAPGELRCAFTDLEAVQYTELRGDTARATFLARKP